MLNRIHLSEFFLLFLMNDINRTQKHLILQKSKDFQMLIFFIFYFPLIKVKKYLLKINNYLNSFGFWRLVSL